MNNSLSSDFIMKITVVTVCRNVLGALRETFAGVMEQDCPDFEYIVVDGASSDGSVDFLRDNASPAVRWISEPDKGIYDAMNKGTRMASGEWVIFMNAGDRFAAKDTLSRLSRELEKAGKDTDVVYGDVLKTDGSSAPVYKKAEPPHKSHRMFFCHQSALTRRSALLSHPFDLRHPYSADFKLYRQLTAERRGFMQVDFPVAVFDTGGVSNRRRSAGLADNMRVIRETDSFIGGIPSLLHLFPSWFLCRLRGK